MKITHSNLNKKAEEILKQQIIKQELPPGTHLKEHKIAEELGVSRTPVREALAALVKAGLVEEIPRRGTYVIELTRKDVQEIYTIREVLEGLATKLATPFFSDEELQAMGAVLTEAENKLKGGNFQLFLKIDTEFHDTIIENSQNERLQNLLSGIHDQIMIFRTWEASIGLDKVSLAIHEHTAILDALMHRDASLAEKRMVQHIERVKQSLLTGYPSQEVSQKQRRDFGKSVKR
ncbi:MAG: GntR family transcriptional regulator [Deltaproteobacteria bacterium]|nr:GntR family transcriptional regulator [Deltaproteobacteria bacterium]